MVSSWTRAVGTRSVAISRLHNASRRCATLALLDKLSRPRTSLLPATTSIIRITHKYASWGRFYAVIITTANSDRSRPNSFRDSWCLQDDSLSLSAYQCSFDTLYYHQYHRLSRVVSLHSKTLARKEEEKSLWVWRSSNVLRHIQTARFKCWSFRYKSSSSVNSSIKLTTIHWARRLV